MNWYQEITLIDQDEISFILFGQKFIPSFILLLPNIAMSRVEYPSVYLFLNIVSMSKRKLVFWVQKFVCLPARKMTYNNLT